jgi:hypothetical protein
MSNAASDYLENKLLDHVLGNTTFTQPADVYLALFTAVTGLETNNPTSEVTSSGTDYARQTVTFAAAVDGTAETDATVTFPVATATYGTVTHVAIMDAATAGNVLFYGALNSSKLIEENDQFVVTAGNLTITMN